jgi:hypothetical protein
MMFETAFEKYPVPLKQRDQIRRNFAIWVKFFALGAFKKIRPKFT